jgi:hypothetical protein
MDPSTQELSNMKTLQEVLDWVGFADDGNRQSWTCFSQALGKPKMVRQIAAIPFAVWERTANAWKVTDKINGVEEETEPSPVEIGHVGLVRRVARLLLNLDPDEVVAQPPVVSGGTAATSAQITAAVQAALPAAATQPPKNKVAMSKVLDQADDTEVVMIEQKDVDILLERWKKVENDGEEPTEDEEATTAQLSTLQHRLNGGGAAFVDLGVWRPHGNRLGRALKFTVHSMRPDGTYAPKEINGPADFHSWARSWTVFAFAMSVLQQATRTRLARYYDRIKLLSEEFPRHWWVIGLADIRMRSEYIVRVRRNCVKKQAEGSLPEYDPTRPWDVVFREAANDHEYWSREVDKKVLLHSLGMASEAKLADEGFGTLEEAGNPMKSAYAGGKGTKRPQDDAGHPLPKKWNKPNPNDGAGKANKPKGGGKKGAGKGSGKKQPQPTQDGTTKGSDGKFHKIQGTQVCFAYNRSHGGCSDICPEARAHLCEKCGQKHRAIGCSVVPTLQG